MKQMAFLVLALWGLLRCAPAHADGTPFFVVVETRVEAAGIETSNEHPQERRWYVSNVVELPEDEEMYTIKKKLIAYVNANIVEPAAKHGVVVDYYDNELEINDGSVIGPHDKAECEEMRAKAIAFHKEQSGNIYSFNLTFGPANGEATSKPQLIYRDKEAANYDGSKPPVVTTTLPVPVKPVTPVVAAPALPTEPQILKSTMALRADRMLRYWKQPNTDNYWSWVPTGAFYVVGPIATGTRFEVDFTLPDGKPWTTVTAPVEKLEPNAVGKVVIPGSDSHMDKRGILETGTFGYKIRLRNELTGTNQTMMTGKFHVAKLHHGNALPAFKNQFEYYVDQDWNLPVGYVWLDWLQEPTVPPLHVAMWFKGNGLDDTKLAAYLFYKGKQIASTKEQTGSAHEAWALLTNSSDDNDPRWERWEFAWNNVRGWNTDTSANNWENTFFLSKNPGDYEVKVLRDGDLARSLKFTVGDDGKIADNGLITSNKIGGIAMIVPVKIAGTADGKWDAAAWKTDAFYGNPLRGFSAP